MESQLKRYQILMKNALDGIHVLDIEGNVVEANDAFCEMLGYSHEEVQHLNLADWNAQWSREQLLERLSNLVGKSARFETVHRRKDGTLIDVEVSTAGIEIDGKIYFFASSRDISERKRAEQKAEVLLLRQRALMDSTLDGIHIMDIHGNIVETNDTFCKMLGYTPEEAAKLNVADWDAKWSHDELMERFRMLVRMNSALFETVHRRKDGTLIDVEVSTTGAEINGQPYLFASSRDIGERKMVEDALKAREERYRTLFDRANDGILIASLKGQIISVNKSFAQMRGYTPEEMVGMNIRDLDSPEALARFPERMKRIQEEGSLTFEVENYHKDGHLFPLEVSVSLVAIDGEMVIQSFSRDITERKEAEEELKLASMVFRNSSEGMLVTDENNRIIAVNPAFTEITGYSLDEVKGQNPRIFRSGRHDSAFYQAMWKAINTDGHWQGEIWDRRKSGEVHAKLLTINTIRNEEGGVHRYVALFSDITEKKQSEELIWRQANFDMLTGLLNRRLFRDRLEQEIAKSERSGLPLAVLLIDLDEFKDVNDILGHDMGDTLLKEAAQRIVGSVRATDTVARLGGDEFIVLLSQLADAGHIEDVAQKIVNRLSEPFQLEGEVVQISASIGITMSPNDGNNIEALMKNADQAMYLSKRLGRNRYSYFTQSLQDAAQYRQQLIRELREAVVAGQFQVYYQPIVDLATGKIHKAEALIRWNHPGRGMVSPGEFIPVAEETGLIVEIGLWLFREVVNQLKEWKGIFDESFQVSINRSPVQFHDHIGRNCLPCLDLLNELKLSGSNIIFEITEGLLLDAEPGIIKSLFKFRDAGIQVALDDFGTGYSSLSYLKKFDIDYLKIDKLFIDHLATDRNDYALCEAIVVMAHRLGLKVIAEGVETEAQRKILADIGCDYGQGYLFSRPVPPDQFEKLTKSF